MKRQISILRVSIKYLSASTPRWVTAVTLLLSLIGVRSGCVANQIALASKVTGDNSLNIAEQALGISKKYFAIEHRPYLLIKPIKWNPLNSYFNVVQSPAGVFIRTQYEVKNVGGAFAKDILFPEHMSFSLPTKQGELSVKDSFPVTLSPGEGLYFIYSVDAKLKDGTSVKDFIDELNSEKSEFEFQFILAYSDQESLNKYETNSRFGITASTARILVSERN